MSFLQFILLLWSFAIAIAAPIADSSTFTASTTAITAQVIVGGLITILTGLLFAFAGYKFFKLTIFLAGAYFLASIALIILANLSEKGIITPAHKETTYIITLIIVGILGGFLALCLWQIAILAIGFIGGSMFAVWLMSLGTHGLITNDAARIAVIIVFGIAGAIAAHFLQKPAIIVCTSIAGSIITFMGIDLFAVTGWSDYIEYILSTHQAPINLGGTPAIIGMSSGAIILAAISILAQFHINRGRTWS